MSKLKDQLKRSSEIAQEKTVDFAEGGNVQSINLKEIRNKRLTVLLTAEEEEKFFSLLKPRETVSNAIRDLILEKIK